MSNPPSPPALWSKLPGAPAPGTLLCDLTDLVDGGVRCIDLPVAAVNTGAPATQTPANQTFRLLILRSGGHVKAYVNRCAHFGVPLSQSGDKLIFTPHQTISCHVHYAKYRWRDGLCISGDCAGESLIAVPVTVNAAGELVVG